MSAIVVQLFNNPDDPRLPRNVSGNLTLGVKDRPTVLYGSAEAAEQEAQRLAKTHPQVQYAVMTIHKVYETTDPKVLTKILNEAGELVLEKQQ